MSIPNNTYYKRFFYLRIIVPPVLLITLLSIIYILSAIVQEKNILKTTQIARIEFGQKSILNAFDGITSDLQSLSESILLQHYLKEPTADSLKDLQQYFFSLSKNKKKYDQVRYLNQQGMEMVRVNYTKNGPIQVAPDKLQNKKKRYYFTDTYALNPGQLFISPFDLNVENGKIEQPRKAVIRIGTPVVDDDGKKRGIILLNYFGQRLLDNLEKAMLPTNNNRTLLSGKNGITGSPMLLNKEGYWLLGPTSADEWGFMFRNGRTFRNDFIKAWHTISSENNGQFITAKGMFTFITIYPLRENQISSAGSPFPFSASTSTLDSNQYCWKLISFVPSENIDTIYTDQIYVGAAVLLLLTIFLLSAWIYFNRLSFLTESAELDIAKAGNQLHVILDTIPALIYIIDSDTHELLLTNKMVRDNFGEIEGHKCWQTIQRNQTGPCDNCILHQSPFLKKTMPDHHTRNSVTGKWYEWTTEKIQWPGHEHVQLQVMFDISQKEWLEEKLKLSSIKHKRLLTKINRLVKKNTAILAGIMQAEALRADKAHSKSGKQFIRNLNIRIRGLATACTLLSDNGWKSLLLSTLCEQTILQVLNITELSETVEINVASSAVTVPGEHVQTLVLILVELTSNSILHALPTTPNLSLTVTIEENEDNTVCLLYKDNGSGSPFSDMNKNSHRKTYGLNTLEALVASSLNGSLKFDSDQGAVCSICFNPSTT